MESPTGDHTTSLAVTSPSLCGTHRARPHPHRNFSVLVVNRPDQKLRAIRGYVKNHSISMENKVFSTLPPWIEIVIDRSGRLRAIRSTNARRRNDTAAREWTASPCDVS